MGNPFVRAGLIGTVAAVVAVIVVFLIADAASGPLRVTPPGGDAVEDLAIGQAIVATLVGGVVGTGLAALLRRFGRSATAFLAVCVVGLALYAIAPFTAAEETATAIWLNVMHLAAAVPIVGLLVREFPSTSLTPTSTDG